MKPTLVQVARQANEYVAGWLLRQPTVKEESVTDWLLDYFDQMSDEVRYYEFNRYEEAKFSGADWDWWFLLRTGCFKIRAQAKKLRSGKDHYSEFARSNTTGYQIDLLLDSSAKHNFYPLYVLYAKTEGVERCRRVPEPIVLSVCSAQEIYELLFGTARRRVESSEILKRTIPLECLFCCPLVTDSSSDGPEQLFQQYFRVPPREGNESQETSAMPRRGFERDVPPIISSLFQRQENGSDTERLLHDYQSKFVGSRGVVIVKVGD